MESGNTICWERCQRPSTGFRLIFSRLRDNGDHGAVQCTRRIGYNGNLTRLRQGLASFLVILPSEASNHSTNPKTVDNYRSAARKRPNASHGMKSDNYTH